MRGTLHGIRKLAFTGPRLAGTRLAGAALFLALSALPGADALACSCGGVSSPCAAYASADAVFAGRVTRVEPESSGADDNFEGEQTARVQVEEAFKGTEGAAEFVFRQPGHNCAPKFKPGERWLFYAHQHKEQKTWEVYGCGRSAPVVDAGDDLLYLRALPEAATRTRISGALRHYEDDPEKGFSLVNNLAGVKVRVTGKAKGVEVLTDSNGVYEVYDLPPGVYNIEPERPYGLRIDFPMVFSDAAGAEIEPGMVALGQAGCAGADFVYASDTVISGRVLGPRGAPLHNVCLRLKPLVDKPGRYFNEFDCTEEDGSYRLERIAPGRYLIEVNDDGKLSGDEPFPTAYAPGVFERARAGVVTVEAGTRLENHDIVIPRLLPTRTLRGVLLYADGKPAARESVAFAVAGQDGRYEETQRAQTDEQGRFALKVLRETAGALTGSLHVYPSTFVSVRDCPEVARLLKANGGSGLSVETKPSKIAAGGDVSDLKLSLPLPYCPLAPKEK